MLLNSNKENFQNDNVKVMSFDEKAEKLHKMDFVFKKKNYMILIAGLVSILLGITLMIGGGSEDPTKFSEEIFNFQRLTLAPILIVSGFVMGVFAIMIKSKK